MGNSLYLDRIERPKLEFGLLRLNFTNLTYINNSSFSVNKTTEAFTSHGLILWKGSFFTLLDLVFQNVEDNLGTLIHPLFHYATIIEESDERIFFTPEEKAKLTTVENNANNYTHPATHSLTEITETLERKKYTSDEKNKLANISVWANKYEHPEFHDLSEIDGLLDVDGFLTPDTPSYLYSNRRHFLSKELSLSFGDTEWIVDDSKGIDAVKYIGTGTVGNTLPFRLGYHISSNCLLMFFPSDTNDLVLCNTINKNILMNKNQSSDIFGTLIDADVIDINPSDIQLNISNQYINRLNIEYGVFGMKFSESYNQGIPSFNFSVDQYGIFNQRSIESRTYDSNLCFRLFFNIMNTSYYISRVLPANPADNRYEWRRSVDGNLIQTIPYYHGSHYVYCSDKVPDNYHTLMFVQHDSTSDGIKFRVFYKRHHQTATDDYLTAFKTTSTVYKHSNDEVVTDIAIAPCIIHTDTSDGKTQGIKAVANDYFLSITSNNGTNSWITIYRLKISTKEITLHQTLSFSYIVNKVGFDSLKVKSVFTNSYFYGNYITFWANDKLYVYGKRFDILNVNFTLVHTIDMVLPVEITNTSIKSCVWYNGTITMPGHIILHTDNYIFIYLVLFSAPIIAGSVFLLSTVSTLESMAYTDKYLSDGKIYNTIPIKSDWMRVLDNRISTYNTPYEEQEKPLVLITENDGGTKIQLFLPLRNLIYQNIYLDSNGAQSPPRSTVGIDYYESANGAAGLYVGQGNNFIKLQNDLMSTYKNPYMNSAMWDYRIDTINPINSYNHYMNSLPIVMFCYMYDSSNILSKRKLICIYNYKQYFIEETDQAPDSDQDGFYGNFQPLVVDSQVTDHTNSVLRYNTGGSDVITYDCVNGNHLMYFGFFGDSYEVTKNSVITSVKGKPGVTCFIEMSPGDIVDVGFNPNIIKILPLDTPPIVSTGYSLLMAMQNDNFSKLYSYSEMSIDNTLITVDNETVTLNVSSLGNCLLMILSADMHSQSSDFSIQASPINPLFMSMINGGNSLGESDDVFIKTENIVPITPTDLSPIDKRYLALNTFGDIVYNNTDGVYPGEWNKPDDVLYLDANCTKLSNTGPYRYLPIAKVNFIDDTITEVISYPQGDFYIVDWFDFIVGTPVVLDNKFMSLGVMIKVLLKNDDEDIFNNDTLINNGVKISFDHEFITIKTSVGQTYVLNNDNTCRMKIIIKRMF